MREGKLHLLSLTGDTALAGVAESTLLTAVKQVAFFLGDLLGMGVHLGFDFRSCVLEVAQTVCSGSGSRVKRLRCRLGRSIVRSSDALRSSTNRVLGRLLNSSCTCLARLDMGSVLDVVSWVY